MPEREPTAAPQSDRKGRALIAAGLLVLAAVPILLTPFPPATDLPQHIAQVRLFKEALADPGGPYVIQWLAPNNLIYVFLLGFWTVLPIGLVARVTLIFIVILWLAGVHGLAAARRRPLAMAIAASLLVFNQSFYWGFLNFMLGFPVFILWLVLTAKAPGRLSGKLWVALAGTSLLLYESHVLWLAAGGLWLIVIGLVKKAPMKMTLGRLSALVPCSLMAGLWYPHLWASRSMAGFDTAAHWSPPRDRLGAFMDAAFGGLRGPTETAVFIFIFLWAALSILQNRRRLGSLVDRDLLAAAFFFLAVVVIAPDMFMNSIFFSSRWFPPALIFLLLGLPAPAFRRLAPKTIVLVVAASFLAITSLTWRSFEKKELTGLQQSLDQVPPSSRVLGLDLVKESELIKGRPFLQLFAYAQVFKGGELNFSFAEHYSGLVAYRTKRDVRWTSGLEWRGVKVRRTDFAFFEFVLVNADDKDHRTLSTFGEVSPVTLSGRWRLYRVKK
jgi:hypothetical protein